MCQDHPEEDFILASHSKSNRVNTLGQNLNTHPGEMMRRFRGHLAVGVIVLSACGSERNTPTPSRDNAPAETPAAPPLRPQPTPGPRSSSRRAVLSVTASPHWE